MSYYTYLSKLPLEGISYYFLYLLALGSYLLFIQDFLMNLVIQVVHCICLQYKSRLSHTFMWQWCNLERFLQIEWQKSDFQISQALFKKLSPLGEMIKKTQYDVYV